MNQFVQYGCGLCAPEGWRNFDVSPSLRLQRLPIFGAFIKRLDRFPNWPNNVEYGDIVKGLPIDAQSCQAVYCSHVLEHLALSEFRLALRNSHTYLHVGGIFRFVIPDLRRITSEYLSSTNPEAAFLFMKYSGLGVDGRPRGFRKIGAAIYGHQEHLWMWDYESIQEELSNAGFSDIRRAKFGDSIEKRITEVEDEDRWKGELGVECKRG